MKSHSQLPRVRAGPPGDYTLHSPAGQPVGTREGFGNGVAPYEHRPVLSWASLQTAGQRTERRKLWEVALERTDSWAPESHLTYAQTQGREPAFGDLASARSAECTCSPRSSWGRSRAADLPARCRMPRPAPTVEPLQQLGRTGARLSASHAGTPRPAPAPQDWNVTQSAKGLWNSGISGEKAPRFPRSFRGSGAWRRRRRRPEPTL